MALITLDELLTTIGIFNATPEQRSRYDLLRLGVEAAIKSYCKWGLEQVAGQIDYYDGNGYLDLPLRFPYVSSVANVWFDPTGFYGTGSNAFSSSTLLTQGRDYSPVFLSAGNAKNGIIRRLSSPLNWFWPSDWIYWGQPGGLAYVQGPYWPTGLGNLKVEYTYGFSTIPDDIKLAVATAVSIIQNTTKYGYPTQSESLADYSYSLAISRDAEFGTVRQLLGAYRDLPISAL